MTPHLDEPWRLSGLEISVAAAPLETDWLWPRVVAPLPAIAGYVQGGGLQIADIDHADNGLFTKAAEAIAWVPSLAAIVATRVASVHLLHAPPGYDVSHSEPHCADRIFVSVPERRDRVGAYRLAESVIHEAMHLHLTVLEQREPLVRDPVRELHSPWRKTQRPVGGVLHGLFVFVCLQAFFDQAPETGDSAAGRHIAHRRREIADQISEVNLSGLMDGLTARGRELIASLAGAEWAATAFAHGYAPEAPTAARG